MTSTVFNLQNTQSTSMAGSKAKTPMQSNMNTLKNIMFTFDDSSNMNS